MKIKDIVNREIVNLTNCDQEPIHIPGSIQPHGFLLGLKNDLSVDFCSANVESFLHLKPEQILSVHLICPKRKGMNLLRSSLPKLLVYRKKELELVQGMPR